MKKELTFEEKVRKMSAKAIILAMVKSLTIPPLIAIDMGTFGSVKRRGGKKICYGCAATNTICQISGKVFDSENIQWSSRRANFVNANEWFLIDFEEAIDNLRIGDITRYNDRAKDLYIAKIKYLKKWKIELPCIYNGYTNKDLIPYKQLAKLQNS